MDSLYHFTDFKEVLDISQIKAPAELQGEVIELFLRQSIDNGNNTNVVVNYGTAGAILHNNESSFAEQFPFNALSCWENILWPVHWGGCHWLIYFANKSNGTSCLLDPLQNKIPETMIELHMRMDQLIMTHTYPFSAFSLQPRIISHPLQTNNFDCGAFIAHFGLECVTNPQRIGFTNPDCSYIRSQMLQMVTEYEKQRIEYERKKDTLANKATKCSTCLPTPNEDEPSPSLLYNRQLLSHLCTSLENSTMTIDESLARAALHIEENSIDQEKRKRLRPPHQSTQRHTDAAGFISTLKLQSDFRRNPKQVFKKLTEESHRTEITPTEAELNSYFTRVSPPPTEMGNMDEFQPKSFPDLSSNEVITAEETLLALKSCTNSAPGSDGITFKEWRSFDPKGVFLTALFNKILREKAPPKSWLTFRTTLVLKPGANLDPKIISNWRPIAILDSSYRIFAKILNKRILRWTSIGDLISPMQKAVGQPDGCAEHNFVLTAMIEYSKRTKTETHICWLDLADAFGSIPHDVIWLTLDRMGLHSDTLEVIKQLYQGSESIYQCQETFSEPIKILQGVKQGCPLSMTIFCMSIDFLITGVNAAVNQLAPAKNPNSISILAYADDLVLCADSRPSLQSLVNIISSQASWAHLRFKPAKCGYFDTLKTCPGSTISIDSTPISIVNEDNTYKYLGVPHGSPKRQSITQILARAVKDFEAVLASKLTMKQKVVAYKTFIAPRFVYAFRTFDIPLTVLYAKSTNTNAGGNTAAIGFDASILKSIKAALKVPQSTTADFLYANKNLGGLGIISTYAEYLTQGIVSLFHLFNSPDPTVRRIVRSELIDVTLLRYNTDVDLLSALKWVCGSELENKRVRYADRSWFSRIRKAFENARDHYNIVIRPRLNGDVLELLMDYKSGQSEESYVVTRLNSRDLCSTLHDLIGQAHYDRWCSLKRQGDTVRCRSLSPHSMAIFRTEEVSDALWKFAIKAHVNGLKLAGSLARSYFGANTRCRRCRYQMRPDGAPWTENQCHIFQHCIYNEGLIRKRHDTIAEMLHTALRRANLDATLEESPFEIVTTKRPDIIVRFPNRTLFIDVKSPYDIISNFNEVNERNREKYRETASDMQAATNKPVFVLTFIVGALGSWHIQNDSHLLSMGFSEEEIKSLAARMTISALRDSHYIYQQHVAVNPINEDLEIPESEMVFTAPYNNGPGIAPVAPSTQDDRDDSEALDGALFVLA